jgi:hypothetical protein
MRSMSGANAPSPNRTHSKLVNSVRDEAKFAKTAWEHRPTSILLPPVTGHSLWNGGHALGELRDMAVGDRWSEKYRPTAASPRPQDTKPIDLVTPKLEETSPNVHHLSDKSLIHAPPLTSN